MILLKRETNGYILFPSILVNIEFLPFYLGYKGYLRSTIGLKPTLLESL